MTNARKTPPAESKRPCAILLSADGLDDQEVGMRVGFSNGTVGKWRKRYAAEGIFGLIPHRAETVAFSADPHFVEKVRDVGGLYMKPSAECAGSQLGREEPMPGLGALPADSSDDVRHAGAFQP